MVSRRENAATHHLYQAWDPVPSLGFSLVAASRGSSLVTVCGLLIVVVKGSLVPRVPPADQYQQRRIL